MSLESTRLGSRTSEFVGLDNYRRLLRDDAFWSSLTTTVTYAALVVALAVGFGLCTALLVNRKFRGRTVARGVLTLPWAFPEIATVLIFIWMMNPSFGLVKLLTSWIPWLDRDIGWFTSSPFALISIVMISVWKNFPFYSIVLLAALQTVPEELHEAAKVEGANSVQRFRHVTLPALRPVLLLLSMLAFVFAFRQFTLIWLTTGGGPGRDTETLVISIYNRAFKFFEYGYAAAIGVAGLLVTLTVAIAFLVVNRRLERKAAR